MPLRNLLPEKSHLATEHLDVHLTLYIDMRTFPELSVTLCNLVFQCPSVAAHQVCRWSRKIISFGATWPPSMPMDRRVLFFFKMRLSHSLLEVMVWAQYKKYSDPPSRHGALHQAPEQALQALKEAMRLNATHPAVAHNAQALASGVQEGVYCLVLC